MAKNTVPIEQFWHDFISWFLHFWARTRPNNHPAPPYLPLWMYFPNSESYENLIWWLKPSRYSMPLSYTSHVSACCWRDTVLYAFTFLHITHRILGVERTDFAGWYTLMSWWSCCDMHVIYRRYDWDVSNHVWDFHIFTILHTFHYLTRPHGAFQTNQSLFVIPIDLIPPI